MMRVLFWSELFWPCIGGAEVFATKLILALQERATNLSSSHDRILRSPLSG